jgi:hypothetical protein
VTKALLAGRKIFKSDSVVGKMIQEAIRIMKQAPKRKPSSASPEGASAMSKDEKLISLFQAFGILPARNRKLSNYTLTERERVKTIVSVLSITSYFYS